MRRLAPAGKALKHEKKCYPRAMKSLRKIAVFRGYAMICALLLGGVSRVAAQTPAQTPTQTPTPSAPVGPDGAESGTSKPNAPALKPPAAAPAQTPAKPDRAPGTIRTVTNIVFVPVTVKD